MKSYTVKILSTDHIRIVPVSWAGVGHDCILVVAVVVYDTLQASPRVLDVVEVPPQVTMFYDGAEVGLE